MQNVIPTPDPNNTTPSTIATHCANCQTNLRNNDKYCAQCGAKIVGQRLNLKYLTTEFSERFLNIDNNLLARTYLALFTKPEAVINGYISGIRKRYLNVANYVALAITITGLQLFIIQRFFPEAMQLPEYLKQQQHPLGDNFMDSFYDYQGIWYLVLIPIYALISKLVFSNIKKYNYVEHIVILGYTQAQLSLTMFLPVILLSAFGMSYFTYSYFGIISMVIYSAYCYKRIYPLTVKRTLRKTLVFLGIGGAFYLALIFIVGIIFVIIQLMSGNLEQMIEAEKVKQGVSYIASSAINWTS